MLQGHKDLAVHRVKMEFPAFLALKDRLCVSTTIFFQEKFYLNLAEFREIREKTAQLAQQVQLDHQVYLAKEAMQAHLDLAVLWSVSVYSAKQHFSQIFLPI